MKYYKQFKRKSGDRWYEWVNCIILENKEDIAKYYNVDKGYENDENRLIKLILTDDKTVGNIVSVKNLHKMFTHGLLGFKNKYYNLAVGFVSMQELNHQTDNSYFVNFINAVREYYLKTVNDSYGIKLKYVELGYVIIINSKGGYCWEKPEFLKDIVESDSKFKEIVEKPNLDRIVFCLTKDNEILYDKDINFHSLLCDNNRVNQDDVLSFVIDDSSCQFGIDKLKLVTDYLPFKPKKSHLDKVEIFMKELLK